MINSNLNNSNIQHEEKKIVKKLIHPSKYIKKSAYKKFTLKNNAK